MEYSSEFLITNVMNMRPFQDNLSKMLISNINKHHQKTMDSYFCSVWSGEDIMMGQ